MIPLTTAQRYAAWPACFLLGSRRASTPAERPGEGDEGWWAGRDKANLPEPNSSHANGLKTRTPSPRTAVPPSAPALFCRGALSRCSLPRLFDARVRDAVLGDFVTRLEK